MSVRATLFRQILRLTGRLLTSTLDIAEIRKKIEALTKYLPKSIGNVQVTPFKIDHIPAYWFEPEDRIPGAVFYYLHGGGYMLCSAVTTHKDLISRLAIASRCKVLAIDYRLAPENPYPAAVDDALLAYRWLLDQDINLNKLAIGGDSAGGGLTFGSLLRMRDEGLLLPVAAVGLSPWTDLAATGASVKFNAKRDMLIPGDGLKMGADFYLAGADPMEPYASPMYGDMKGLPYSLIQVGSDEVLLDDSRRLADALKKSGVPVILQEWAGMQHVWQAFGQFIPEGRQAIVQIGDFIQSRMS